MFLSLFLNDADLLGAKYVPLIFVSSWTICYLRSFKRIWGWDGSEGWGWVPLQYWCFTMRRGPWAFLTVDQGLFFFNVSNCPVTGFTHFKLPKTFYPQWFYLFYQVNCCSSGYIESNLQTLHIQILVRDVPFRRFWFLWDLVYTSDQLKNFSKIRKEI